MTRVKGLFNWLKERMPWVGKLLLITLPLALWIGGLAVVTNLPWNHTLLLQYLQILMSWPVVVAVVAITLIATLRPALQDLFAYGLTGRIKDVIIQLHGRPQNPPQPSQEIERQIRQEWSFTPDAVARFLRYEQIIRRTWRTQFELVRDVYQFGQLSLWQVAAFYHARSIYRPWMPLHSYIAWLESVGLLQAGPFGSVLPGPETRNFLTYCELMKYGPDEFVVDYVPLQTQATPTQAGNTQATPPPSTA